MGTSRATLPRYLGGILGGLIAITVAGYLRYQWQIEAYNGAIMIREGKQLGVSAMASGMFDSIIGAMLVGLVVLIAVIVAQSLTLDIRAAIAVALGGLVPLAAFNLQVANFITAHPVLLDMVPKSTASIFGQIVSTANEVFVPLAVGLGVGFFINLKTRERLEAEANRPVFKGRDDGDSYAVEQVETLEPAAQFAAATQTPPKPVVSPGEKRAILCTACGASNAPIRSNCLRCGAILAT